MAVVEQRQLKYVIKFNRYYIFWEDYGEPYDEKAAAMSGFQQAKLEKPAYWNWKLVERETIIREREVE